MWTEEVYVYLQMCEQNIVKDANSTVHYKPTWHRYDRNGQKAYQFLNNIEPIPLCHVWAMGYFLSSF